jgi:nuclease-like protein
MVGRWSFAESERCGRSGGSRRMPVRRSRDAPGRRERLLSYARRQQYRRLSRAAAAAVASAAAMMLALAVASAGAVSAAGVLLVLALGFGLYARHWLSLAHHSRVGARSEDEVRRTLAPLQAEGWRLRHSLPWHGRGDIDSLAITPTGVGFAIETKTRAYDDRHLARVRDQAAWVWRRRRRWCRRGAVPVVCLVHARGVHRLEQNVLVVSIDRLIPVLRSAVGDLGMRGLSASGTVSNEPSCVGSRVT